jgi:hypothetical protein
MRGTALVLSLILMLSVPTGAVARDAYETWDDRCEECHGDADGFSGKYMWLIEGKLQGQHHIHNLRLFMANHYIPEHEIEAIYDMLLAQANTLARFDDECSSCHDSAEVFVRKAIATRVSGMVGVESGILVSEFLQTHQDLGEADAEFFTRLITRVFNQITGSLD